MNQTNPKISIRESRTQSFYVVLINIINKYFDLVFLPINKEIIDDLSIVLNSVQGVHKKVHFSFPVRRAKVNFFF